MADKWSSDELKIFLSIYQEFECLWNTSIEDYIKRDLKEAAFLKFLTKVKEKLKKNLTEDKAKKKIKCFRDAYRNEVNKVKKSMKSGAGTDEVYKPKLAWFDTADSFLRRVIVGRDSQSNIDLQLLRNVNQDTESRYMETTEVDLELVDSPTVSSELSEKVQVVTDSTATPHERKRTYISTQSQEVLLPTDSTATTEKRKRTINSTKPPRRSAIKSAALPSKFELAVNKLHEIAQVASGDTEDQYKQFAKHIAAQLRELPLRRFIVLQNKIQTLITEERLATLDYQNENQQNYSQSIIPPQTQYSIASPGSDETCFSPVENQQFSRLEGRIGQLGEEEQSQESMDIIQRALLDFSTGHQR